MMQNNGDGAAVRDVTVHSALKSRIMYQFFYSHRSCRRCFVKKCYTTRLFLPNLRYSVYNNGVISKLRDFCTLVEFSA